MQHRIEAVESALLTGGAKQGEHGEITFEPTAVRTRGEVESVARDVATKQIQIDKEKDSRKLNVILYRVPEIKSEDVGVRKEGDRGCLCVMICWKLKLIRTMLQRSYV